MNYCVSSYNYSEPEYPTLARVQETYKAIHPYLSLVICCYGIVTNIINIVVLTKPNMRNSINCILTGVAVADMVTMTSYIPFVYYYFLLDKDKRNLSQQWITFLAVHMNLTLISHTSSIWLGVIMAAMRYFFVSTTTRGAKTLDVRPTIIVCAFTFLGAALLIIPNCLTTEIFSCLSNSTGDVYWHLKVPTFRQKDSKLLHTVTFFVYPVAGKIIPCTLISIFGGLLLHTLRETDRRSRRLKGEKSSSSNGNNQNHRTTTMLLAIIALYIISEMPQSILLLLCIFVENFFINVYNPLGNFIDLLSLINSAINFITYIAMSSQFRSTLKETGCACLHRSSCHKCGKKNALRSTKYSKTPPAPV